MKKDNKNKSGCLIFLMIFIIILILSMVGIMFLYTKDPIGFQENLNKWSEQGLSFIEQNTGITLREGKTNENDYIEFPEEEKLTEAQKYYYYQQLSDTSKKIYLTIEKNVDKLTNGEDNIPLPSSLNDVANSENGKELVAEEFQKAWDAFVMDRSEYFYLDSSKVCLVTKVITNKKGSTYEFYISKDKEKGQNYFTNEFSSKEEAAIKQVEEVKNEIIQNATGNNYDKIKYIHDWIIDNVEYDTSNGNNTADIYGCLVNKKVVCEGYARAFKYLMDELEIPCVLVSGTATDENGKSERHAWNYVYIKNNWYAIDTTWDDPIIIGNGKIDDKIRYKYFLKGSNTMKLDHITSGQITQDGYNFTYPELSEEDIQ